MSNVLLKPQDFTQNATPATDDLFVFSSPSSQWYKSTFAEFLTYLNSNLSVDDVVKNTGTSSDSEVPLFDGTTGKLLKSGSGMVFTGTSATMSGSLTSGGFIISGGAATSFLKADGSLDSNTYLTSAELGNYLPLTGGTLSGGLAGTSGSFSGVFSIGGTLDVTGPTSINNTLDVVGRADIGGVLDVTGATDIGGTLDVTGATTITNTLDVDGNATFSGDVGIGTTSPSAKLDVNGDAFFSGDITVDGGLGTIQGNGTTNFRIKSKGTTLSQLQFADFDANNPGMISYDHTNNSMNFRVNSASNRLTINSSGNANFSGDVSIGGATILNNRQLSSSTSGNAAWRMESLGNNECFIELVNSTDGWACGMRSASGNSFVIRRSSVNVLEIDTSQNATFSGDVTADDFILSSDIRLKDVTKDLGNGFVAYKYKSGGKLRYGTTAQYAETKYPSVVSTDEDGFKKVSYIDYLCATVAELSSRIDKLEAKLDGSTKH